MDVNSESTISVIGTIAATYSIAALIIWLAGAIVMGIITHHLAGKKGYTGYFWTGFFLHTIGLIYVAGLPVNNRD